MMLVMVAIAGSDLLFALDSIPAIFGLTQSVYIVFTATAFSLMGLRQLYFLIDGLLDRLVYLSYGLATILAFIGVKLILHAMHENNLPFINHGEPCTWSNQHRNVADGHRGRSDHYRACLAAQPQGPRAADHSACSGALREVPGTAPRMHLPPSVRTSPPAGRRKPRSSTPFPAKLRDELIEKEDEYHALVMRARTAQDAHSSSK